MKTPKDLQREVLDELDWEPSINAAQVGVAVHEDGVVTLSGEVESYMDKLTAEQVAMRVAGVRAVADELKVRLPLGSERDDTAIAEAAVRALEWNVQVPANRVKLTVKDGWVTLDGTVEWFFEKDEAARAIRHLTGVRGVSNLITVKPKLTPAQIKTRIDEALRRSAELDAQRIRVEVQDGRITLSGTVRSWSERQEAERAAWRARGVAAVDNRIAIEPAEPALIG